jgi:hypothetical protein
MQRLNDEQSDALKDTAVEVLLCILVLIVIQAIGFLHYQSSAATFQIQLWFLLSFPLWGLFFIRDNKKWHHRLIWLSPLILLLNPFLGLFFVALRLCDLSGFTRAIAKGFCLISICLEVLNVLPVLMFVFGSSCDTLVQEIKVGRVIIAQYVTEVALDSHSLLNIERRIYLLPQIYIAKNIDQIKDQWEPVNLKVVDNKFIEYNKYGDVVRIKAALF